jgi:hypothetical protein
MRRFIFIQIFLLAFIAGGCGDSANTNTSGTATNTTTNKPINTPEKKEGLFSFPPPKVVDVTEIEHPLLVNAEGSANTFSSVSQKLVARLQNGGYLQDHYRYFWNNDNEFAIVTAMERINPDGSPFTGSGNERWKISDSLPRANNSAEYVSYLISGKRVYYRVFAFIVSAKDYSFQEGPVPSFTMAKKWVDFGKPKLGGNASSAPIREVPFDEQYHCYALLYLFVNHTSLDIPKAVNDLNGKDEMQLMEGLEIKAKTHLEKTGIMEVK